MTAKNKPVNILNDILSDSHTGAIRGLDELNALIHQSTDSGNEKKKATTRPKKTETGSAKLAAKAQRQPAARTRTKRKTTHYLSREVFEELGEAKQLLSEYLPAGNKLKASKSKIVDTAVKILLEEFETKGKDSILVKRILKK